MDDLHQIGLGGHYGFDRLVGPGRLVNYARILAAFDTLGIADMLIERDEALGLVAAHDTPCAMAAAVEALGVAQPAHDEALRPHRARDDPQHALGCAHRP